MKGPIRKHRKVGFGLDGLEVATFFAGLLVVTGLLMESGPEAWVAIIKRVWPHREITGNVLVTIGVFAEVAIGLFIARSAKRAQLQAEAQIAEVTERASKAEERAALAEQAAAEANLARVQLERQLARREIPAKDRDVIAKRLSLFAGQQIDVCSATGNMESMEFARHIVETLHQAGWNAKHLNPGSLVVGGYADIFSYSVTSDEKSRAAMSALLQELLPFAGAGSSGGVWGMLGPPPRIHLKVHEKPALIRRSSDAG